jgi:aspartate-semialdehyde dehydrogenase
LDREIGLAGATAVILRPAADFGEPALEELREQTIRLLTFADLPLEIFGTQLAFNVLPQSRLDRLEPGVEARIVRESAEILDRDPPILALRMVTAPVFHGHAFQLHVRPAAAVPIERACGVLEAAGLLDPQSAPTSPLEIESRLRLSPPEEDGAGGFWLWGVAADVSKRAAEQAVRLAARLRTLQAG